MKVLVLGAGGREHALSWKISRSSTLDKLYVMSGNAGTEQIAENINGDYENVEEVVATAKKLGVDLVVVGPEAPLVKGVADRLEEERIPVFGSSSGASLIEGSKIFSKKIMNKYDIPTGKAKVFSNFELAKNYIHKAPPPIVVKADGLCGGKGVTVAKTKDKALEAARELMINEKFGTAGKKILIEEFLSGEEVSYFVLTDGKNIIPLTSAQDYKRAYDKDKGPNTGGMGSYSPYPKLSGEDEQFLIEKIFEPTIYALKKEGSPYRGVLYGGLIRTDEGFKVLEFNCRFGDPESQVIIPRIEGDFLGALAAVAEKNLNNAPKLSITDNRTVTVVMASGGYPESYKKGFEITGIDNADTNKVIVFHAGTTRKNGKVYTNGGRVLNVVGIDSTFSAARAQAYKAVSHIFFENAHYRKDIGERVMGY